MPRIRPSFVRAVKPPPDYFDSLEDLTAYSPSINQPSPPRRIPFSPRPASSAGKLLFCHDYKGGYNELEYERDYTVQHWNLIDTFIYFSHHLVSLPPPGYIRTAHRHSTKILGTIIFEHQEGTRAIAQLTRSLTYADRLVDLAIERGFEGYLVNVEVELLGAEHARELMRWVHYLTTQIEERVPGGEVIWYDAVTSEGKLRWQNQLNALNLPFFKVSSAIFLNYGWDPVSYPSNSIGAADAISRARSDVYVGIDIWGRGQFGGAGFETRRSLDYIKSGLSTALFAPAWTLESSDLGHSLTTREGYEKWRKDDDYLWIGLGGSETMNVLNERIRLDRERKEGRGVQRARMLAHACSTPGSYIGTFDYNAPFPLLPPATTDNHRPISAYHSPAPSPSSNNTFYTNFSSGSGFDFYFDGEPVMRAGWTDIDFSYPRLLSSVITEEDAWIGKCSLRVDGTVEVCRTRIAVDANSPVRITMIWKSSTSSQLGIKAPDDPRLDMSIPTTIDLARGWKSTSVIISSILPLSVSSLTASMTSPDVSSHGSGLIGSISIVPADRPCPPQLGVKIDRLESSSVLRWKPNDDDKSCLAFVFYVIFRVLDRKSVFVGTTSASEFEVDLNGRYVVNGVVEDGSVVTFATIDALV